MSSEAHSSLILDQFTRQATPFSTASAITDAGALRMIVDAAGPRPDDTMLDVACGGGIVVCAFAPHLRQATGIDMTPAMLDRARRLAAEKCIANVTWQQGDVSSLPWPDGFFTIVVSRFAVHHFPDPSAVLREMVRVCAPGGCIVVADTCASSDPVKAALFNRLEKLRDPSHVRALPLAELHGLYRTAGLPKPQTQFYELRELGEEFCSPARSPTPATMRRSPGCSPPRSKTTVSASRCAALAMGSNTPIRWRFLPSGGTSPTVSRSGGEPSRPGAGAERRGSLSSIQTSP